MKNLTSKTVVAYLGAVFVVGLVIGVMTGYTMANPSPSTLPSRQEAQDRWLAKYESELALTEDQVRAIQPLLPQAVEELGGIWYRAIMTMGAVGESVDRKVEPLLDDAQRRRLLAYIQKGRAERLRVAQATFPQQTGADGDLWAAARSGNLDAIRRHLAEGADVDKPDLGFGLTPLTTAAIHGRAAAVALLLQEGAEVNARSPDGNTALHAAAFFGRSECVERLLQGGADPSARNQEGKPPLPGMSADWGTIQFIAAILQVELDQEQTMAGRAVATERLRRELSVVDEPGR